MRRFCLETQESESCIAFGTRIAGVPDMEVETSADGWIRECDVSMNNGVGLDTDGIWVRPSVPGEPGTWRVDRANIANYRDDGPLALDFPVPNGTAHDRTYLISQAIDVSVVIPADEGVVQPLTDANVFPVADITTQPNALTLVVPITGTGIGLLNVPAGGEVVVQGTHLTNALEDDLVAPGDQAARLATR